MEKNIEERIESIKNFYSKIEELIDNLPSIPEKLRALLKDSIVSNKELEDLIDGIGKHRPPRILLIGRTGFGKSSLVNALCSSYLAQVSDTFACTADIKPYKYMNGDNVLLEILDTRGICESESLISDISAEDMLVNQVNKFLPDVAIFMLNCTHRDDVNKDVIFVKKLKEEYYKTNGTELPIVAVVNKCDQMHPASKIKPSEYPQGKILKINEMVQYYKHIIVENGLKVDDIVAVSSLIEWGTADGTVLDAETIGNLPKRDIENLQIAFDGRYNIDKLSDILENAIQDFDAKMGFKVAARLKQVVHMLAEKFNSIFSRISMTVAVVPIPIADIFILTALQAVLVYFIAALSGREISLKTAIEFICSVCGIWGIGNILKFAAKATAKYIAKFAAKLVPVVGGAVNAVIASAGTSAIGNAAIGYYIDGKDLNAVKKAFKKDKEALSAEIS